MKRVSLCLRKGRLKSETQNGGLEELGREGSGEMGEERNKVFDAGDGGINASFVTLHQLLRHLQEERERRMGGEEGLTKQRRPRSMYGISKEVAISGPDVRPSVFLTLCQWAEI